MSFNREKGLLSIATSYKDGVYTYEKIDSLIGADNLQSTPNQMQDIDSFVNANGFLKRTLMPHSRTKIEGNTPNFSYEKKNKLISILNDGFSLDDGECSEPERKLRIRYYNDWKDVYSYAFCYVSDITFQYAGTYEGKPRYLPIRLAFIEY